MQNCKWLGVCLLLLCGIACGGVCHAYFKRRYRQAMGYLALLRYIRLQIDCFCAPISKILQEGDKQMLADCGALGGERYENLTVLLSHAHLYLAEEVCGLLWEFARGLGGGYREEQLRCCDYYLARLAPYCDKLRQELPGRVRMGWMLSLACALMLILLLL